ncbi:MAG: hypothetical protein PUP93_30475 [Rhizonema sp. NSF051]|nr:hypothetical protein [Rhizonema sp. NSF051]
MEYDLGRDTVKVVERSAIAEVSLNNKLIGSCWVNDGSWTAATQNNKAKKSGFPRRDHAESWLIKRHKGILA